jgi:hypothetical protein
MQIDGSIDVATVSECACAVDAIRETSGEFVDTFSRLAKLARFRRTIMLGVLAHLVVVVDLL